MKINNFLILEYVLRRTSQGPYRHLCRGFGGTAFVPRYHQTQPSVDHLRHHVVRRWLWPEKQVWDLCQGAQLRELGVVGCQLQWQLQDALGASTVGT